MNAQIFNSGRFKKTANRVAAVFLILWTILLTVSLLQNLDQHRQTMLIVARDSGRTAFQKDVLYRRWNSGHGGVYAPITKTTQPNPYLVLPDRIITDTFGKTYTLVNPAYMTRQVFELQEESTGIIGHITSLKPIRPENAADEWETRALQAFESGVPEVSSVEKINGRTFMRFMKPLFVEEICLPCHAAQGYQVGEIRGGISESVPLGPLEEAGLAQRNSLILAHASIWVFGLLGIYSASRFLKQSVSLQQKAEEELVHMSIHDSLTGLHNRRYFEDYFRRLEEIKNKPVTLLSCDLDNLKLVNDTLGHAAGDQLLKGAAEVLKASFRSEDIIARIGGDEFVVILLVSDTDQIDKAIARVREQEQAWNHQHPEMKLSISIGAASTSMQMSLSDALKLADNRMYADKASRKAGIS
ncbi:MAG: diguanylate cyclase [Anaerolineaceae bacterium]